MKWVVDRIEDGIAVLENLDAENTEDAVISKELPRAALPKGTKDGTVLIEDGGRLTIDREGTAARAAEIRALFEHLKKK